MSIPAVQYKQIETLPRHEGSLPKNSTFLLVIDNQTYQWATETVDETEIDNMFGTPDDGAIGYIEFVTDRDIDILFRDSLFGYINNESNKLPYEFISDQDVDKLFSNSSEIEPEIDVYPVQELLDSVYSSTVDINADSITEGSSNSDPISNDEILNLIDEDSAT